MDSLRVVICARYSSSSQRGETIEGQFRDCAAFAERNSYTVIGTDIDRAISGTTDNCPELQGMIKGSKRNRFDLVLVWKFDRFSRGRFASAKYNAQLKENGVKVVSATEIIGCVRRPHHSGSKNYICR